MSAMLRRAICATALLTACSADGPLAPNSLQPPATRSFSASTWTDWETPVNLGAVVNATTSEVAPAISKDGLSLYFASDRAGGSGGFDLYVSRRESTDEPWGSPVNLGPTVNSTAGESGPYFTRDGHWLYFTSTRALPQGAVNFGGYDLWVSWRSDVHDDFAWETPRNLGAPVNGARSDLGGSIWGPEMYFWRGDAGTQAHGDIFLSTMTDDGFHEPVRVDALSSDFHDERPSIRFDGREIFFSSNRSGSHDLWVATRAGNGQEWSAPVNLGPSINTSSDDRRPSLSGDATTLFFDSNRPGGSGGYDLYMTTRHRDVGAP